MNDRLTAGDKDALWSRISADLPKAGRVNHKAGAMSALGIAAGCAIAFGASYMRMQTPVLRATSGPLAFAESGGYPSLELFSDGGDAKFEDQSRVHATPGTRVELLDNAALRFALKQPRGSATYSVTPGGTRHWTVDTPLAMIEVVGTEFEVSSSSNHVQVHVAHGVVIVRGERVPGHAVRLTDGQAIELNAAPEPTTTTAPAVSANAAVGNATRAPRSPIAVPPRHDLRAPNAQSIEEARVSELMSFADALRAGGNHVAAAAALKQVVSKHPRDSRSALSAFTLGRLEMDVLHHPEEARWALERALALELPPALQSDAKRRLEELRTAASPSPVP